MTALLLLSLLAAAPSAPPPGVEKTAIIDRCVTAYGGARALERASAFRQEGTVRSDVLHPGAPGRIVRTWARPGRLRVEITYPGEATEVRVVDGAKGWRFGEPVEGASLAAMILQAARMDLPWRLDASRDRVVDRGTGELEGGARVRVLALEVAPGVQVEAAIDLASGRIVRSHGLARVGGASVEFITSYSDFRTVDGLLVAFREENWANGRGTGATVLERVDVRPKLGGGSFRP